MQLAHMQVPLKPKRAETSQASWFIISPTKLALSRLLVRSVEFGDKILPVRISSISPKASILEGALIEAILRYLHLYCFVLSFSFPTCAFRA
jgi:hypothetical protein